MYKIGENLYIRGLDERNFSLCSPQVSEKTGETYYENIAYFGSVHFLNEYCKQQHNCYMFEELYDAFDQATKRLVNSPLSEINFANNNLQFTETFNDESDCFIGYFNTKLNGYFINKRHCCKSGLTRALMKLFIEKKPINEIVELLNKVGV